MILNVEGNSLRSKINLFKEDLFIGKHFASKLRELKILASHPSHWAKISELLTHTTNLEVLTVEHLKLPNPHGHHLVVKYAFILRYG